MYLLHILHDSLVPSMRAWEGNEAIPTYQECVMMSFYWRGWAHYDTLHVHTPQLYRLFCDVMPEEDPSTEMCTCCDVLSSVKHLKLETSPSLVNVHHTRHVQHAHMQVEDRRVDAERKLISLQVKYNTLEKTHSTVKQQMKKMKVWHFQSSMCVYGGSINIFRLLYCHS